ncbi:MAG: DUF1273 family protein [Clostridia bacterium]|nr:DUF1273 family protein [Clostridia bacterium]
MREKIKEAITDLIENQGITTFYSGGMGNFDMLCENVARELKRKYPIKLCLIMPYMTKRLNTDREYYNAMYDEIIIPDLGDVHYKRAITERNKWMVNCSDVVLCYVTRSSGGAYRMREYAEAASSPIDATQEITKYPVQKILDII